MSEPKLGIPRYKKTLFYGLENPSLDSSTFDPLHGNLVPEGQVIFKPFKDINIISSQVLTLP